MRRELLREVSRADDARADGGRQPAVHPWPSTQPAAVQFGAGLKKCAGLCWALRSPVAVVVRQHTGGRSNRRACTHAFSLCYSSEPSVPAKEVGSAGKHLAGSCSRRWCLSCVFALAAVNAAQIALPCPRALSAPGLRTCSLAACQHW